MNDYTLGLPAVERDRLLHRIYRDGEVAMQHAAYVALVLKPQMGIAEQAVICPQIACEETVQYYNDIIYRHVTDWIKEQHRALRDTGLDRYLWTVKLSVCKRYVVVDQFPMQLHEYRHGISPDGLMRPPYQARQLLLSTEQANEAFMERVGLAKEA